MVVAVIVIGIPAAIIVTNSVSNFIFRIILLTFAGFILSLFAFSILGNGFLAMMIMAPIGAMVALICSLMNLHRLKLPRPFAARTTQRHTTSPEKLSG